MRITFAVFVLFALFCAACASSQRVQSTSGGTDSLPPEFAQILREYETGWRNKDEHALAALFAEDGFVLPNGRPPVRGRDNIRAHYEDSGGPLFLHALAWAQAGDVGYIIGVYNHEPGPPETATGKYTLTLKRDRSGGGGWRIMSDMDSSNQRR